MRVCSRAAGACAVSVFAVAIALQPAVARHSHRASHGVHERHGRQGREPAPPYADIVLDANSGKVLHAEKADEQRHPASLTKIMTLYLLFEKLEAGKLRLDSQLPVSEHASEQAPTKLGLKPGQTIAVEDAIRGLVTKSANDAAVVVAEAIGGSERDFAEMMTAKARALGMMHTVYRNASGLPNDEQVTTARDEATLGRAINDRFPRYYRYFSTPSFTWQGETLRNHNHLLGRVEGMDGIKTGYTQASGFNLVASVRRSDRHIVSVVMGGTSAGARDARMRSLIEDYINAASPQKNMMIASATTKADAMRREEARKEKEVDARKAEQARKDEARLTALVRSATAESASDATRTRSADAAGTKNVAPKAGGSKDTAAKDTAAKDTATTDGAAAPESGTYSVASASMEPIKPVQVKTLKVKMAPAQIAALAPAATALTPVLALPAPVPATQSPDSTPAPATPVDALKREPNRDLIAESLRTTAQKENAAAKSSSATSSTPTSAAAAPATTTTKTASITAAPAAAPPVHTGWMIQVGAFDVEQEARERLSIVQTKAGHLLKHADAFTEPVTAGDKTFYRARFAGIEKDQAEAVCKQLRRSDIACMAIKN